MWVYCVLYFSMKKEIFIGTRKKKNLKKLSHISLSFFNHRTAINTNRSRIWFYMRKIYSKQVWKTKQKIKKYASLKNWFLCFQYGQLLSVRVRYPKHVHLRLIGIHLLYFCITQSLSVLHLQGEWQVPVIYCFTDFFSFSYYSIIKVKMIDY